MEKEEPIQTFLVLLAFLGSLSFLSLCWIVHKNADIL